MVLSEKRVHPGGLMRYEDMEYQNFSNVLNCVLNELPSPSKAEIAKYLGLSRTASSQIVNKLIHLGILREGDSYSNSLRGRPGKRIMVDNGRWFVLGASLYEQTWQFVVTDLSGKVKDLHKISIDNLTRETLLDTLIEGLSLMKDKYGKSLIPGVGIGIPGVVDTQKGDFVFAYDLQWFERFNVSSCVEKAIGIKAYVMNRFTLEGVAEFKFANPEKEKNMVYIGIGTGIRSAIFINGTLLEGATFSAGRISHIQVDSAGKKCSCGRIGCLITEANEDALICHLRNAIEKEGVSSVFSLSDLSSIRAEDVCKAADNGDQASLIAFSIVAKALYKAVIILSDLINPHKIIIGGPVGNCACLSEMVNRMIDASQDRIKYDSVYIFRSSIGGELSSAIGAASLVTDHILELLL